MAAYTPAPWWVDETDDVIIIRGSDGDSIAGLKKTTVSRLPEEQEANAELMSMAPEMFASLNALIRVMRKSDAENADPGIDSDEWDAALEDAEALVDLLSEVGVCSDYTVTEVFHHA